MTIPHPMLAAKDVPVDKLRFPMLLSPKIDGIRAFVWDGVVYSRSLKPIPNKHVQLIFGRKKYHGFDGELVVGEPNAPDVFNKTQSGVMSVEGQPDVTFHVFDLIDTPVKHAIVRMLDLTNRVFCGATDDDCIRPVLQVRVEGAVGVDILEHDLLAQGYEGVMLRPVDALYKHGRATPKSQELVKVKRFEDDEAVVVGFEELTHNLNAQEVNELGRTKRSTSKSGRVSGGVLGALVCVTLSDWKQLNAKQQSQILKYAQGIRDQTDHELYENMTFGIGTGFNAEQRRDLWLTRQTLPGYIAKFKHQPHGKKDKPRLPVFIGFRDEADMS